VYHLVTDPEDFNSIALDPSRSALVSKLRRTAFFELLATDAKFADALSPTMAFSKPRKKARRFNTGHDAYICASHDRGLLTW